jgi:cell division protein FtsI/penicillin-binding protein 2
MNRSSTHSTAGGLGAVGGAGRALKLRAALTLGSVLVAFLLLGARLVSLQVVHADGYRHLALRQQILKRELAARRGCIYDRHGRLLASTVQRWSVFADPKAVEHPKGTALLLARHLDLSARRLRRKLRKDCYFVWVKRQISDEDAERVRQLDLPGVFLRKEHRRLYPQGRLAAPVIGFTDVDGKGLAGIERQMDALLRGRPGMERVLCDGGRRAISSPSQKVSRAPFNGYDVVLTLDAYAQSIAEQELARAAERHAPECATALVLDVRDGSVLAMASWPSFDPQAPAASPVRNQRNIAVSDAYEYGSAFKPVAVAVALEGGQVTAQTEFDCHRGEWRLGRRTLHDVHPYGVLTVSDIICHSSNIGAAQIGMALGAELLHAGVRRFGFGEPTGIALPGEIGGIVRPARAWNSYSVVSVSFGQELAVTPLAMARAFAAFGRGGALLQPRIVQAVRHARTGKVIYTAGPPRTASQPVSAQTARQVLHMLGRVVQEGTGRRAKHEDYPLGGKTGTAQLLRPDRRGYSEDRYLSSFVAVGPLPNPRIAVLVTLKAPSKGGHYGGTVAAPAVREIAVRTLRYLCVPPAERVRLALGEPA